MLKEVSNCAMDDNQADRGKYKYLIEREFFSLSMLKSGVNKMVL